MRDAITHRMYALVGTTDIVALSCKALADDGTYNYWLALPDGTPISGVYPYAAGPKMAARRQIGLVYSVIQQDSFGVTVASA